MVSLALIQSSVLFRFSLGGARLNLVLLSVVSWSLLRGAREGIVWGFLGGLALDFLSGAPFGSCAFALTLVGYLPSLGRLTLYRTSPLLPSAVALAANIIHDSILMTVLIVTGHFVPWRDVLLQVTMPTALLGALVIPLVYRALAWLHRRTLPEETEL